MSGNRGVAYVKPGEVEVRNTDFPTFELKDGPGVNAANVGSARPISGTLSTS